MSEKTPEQKALDAEMAKYEGNYIESADLMRGNAKLVIKDVVPPNKEKDKGGEGKPISKPILVFEGTAKRLILGKTNERIVKAIHGRKASDWLGGTITLGVRYLPKAFGEVNVPTVRVIPPDNVPLPMGVREHFGLAEPKSKVATMAKTEDAKNASA